MRWLSTGWKRLGDISLAQWLWGLLVPGSTTGALVGWLAYQAHAYGWVIVLAAVWAFAGVSVMFAAWRSHSASSVAGASFDELKRRVRDQRLAELQGAEEAERIHRNRLTAAFMGLESVVGDMSKAFKNREEEAEARRKGRNARLERGEHE